MPGLNVAQRVAQIKTQMRWWAIPLVNLTSVIIYALSLVSLDLSLHAERRAHRWIVAHGAMLVRRPARRRVR